MLTILPSSTLFMSSLILGTTLSVSSPQWLMVWAGLEINLISFIPLMIQNQTNNETEGAIKYFLTQALGSSLLLLGATTLAFSEISIMNSTSSIIIIMTSLFIKMGAAPFHFWFPHVMSSLSWNMCFLLATWQKLAPIFLATLFLHHFNKYIMVVAALSALVGGLGGINQTQLRGLIAYSSIGHLGWIMAASIINQTAALLYTGIYILISGSLILMIYMSKITLRNTSHLFSTSSMSSYMIIVLLLSLGGMPPLLGFMPKWLVLDSLSMNNLATLASILILGSLMNLFYYINLLMNTLMSSTPLNKYKSSPTKMPQLMVLASITLPAFPLMFIM